MKFGNLDELQTNLNFTQGLGNTSTEYNADLSQDELRAELKRYKDLNVTPEKVALLIKFFKERTSTEFISTDMKLVEDSIRKDKLEKQLECVLKERDEYKKYFDMATQDIANFSGLYKKMEDERDEIAELCAKLIVLCSPPKSWIPKLFRPLSKGIGDYMGSGYPFIDSFNKIITSFTENATDEVYKVVESATKMESCIKYSEIEE